MCAREEQRERERERGKERIPSGPRVVFTEPDVGLELTNCEIMTRAEIKSQISTTGPPRRPKKPFLKCILKYKESVADNVT